MGRCCANCVWSIYPEEEEIMEEQVYDAEDSNRPIVGNCSLDMEHNNDYVCTLHDYKDGLENIHVLYDEEYFGKGYLIIHEADGEIIRFIKIYEINEMGVSNLYIKGYEKGTYNNGNKSKKSIEIVAYELENNELYECLKKLALQLNDRKVDSFDLEKSSLRAVEDWAEASIILTKDIHEKDDDGFINIYLGDNYTCKNYSAIYEFYNSLSKVPESKISSKIIKQLIKK